MRTRLFATVLLLMSIQWFGTVAALATDVSRHTSVQGGWLAHEGRAVLGWIQHNGWWRDGQRPNLTRRSVGDPQGDIRPNRTEDLDAQTNNMLRYACIWPTCPKAARPDSNEAT